MTIEFFFEIFVNIIYGFMYTDDQDEVEKYLKKYDGKNPDPHLLNDLCAFIDTRIMGLPNHKKAITMSDLFERAIVKNIIYGIEKTEGALHDPHLIVQKIQTILLRGQFNRNPISLIEIYLINYILNLSFEKYLDKQSFNDFIFKLKEPSLVLNRLMFGMSSDSLEASPHQKEADGVFKIYHLYNIVLSDKRFNKNIEKSFNKCFADDIWPHLLHFKKFGKINSITKAAERITTTRNRLLKEKEEKNKKLFEITPKNPSKKYSDELKSNIKKIDLNKSKLESKNIEKDPFSELKLSINKIKSYASASEIKEKNIEKDLQEIKELADLSKANEKFHCLIAVLYEKMDVLHQSILSLKTEKNKISHLENDPKSQPFIEEIDEAIKKYEDNMHDLTQSINKINKEKSIISDKLLVQIESNKHSLSQLSMLHKKIVSLDKTFNQSPSKERENIAKKIAEAIRAFNKEIENFNGDQLTDQQTQALERYQTFVSACAKKYNKEPKEKTPLKKEIRQNSTKKHVTYDEKATEPPFQKPLNDEKTSTTAILNRTLSKPGVKPEMKVVPSYMKKLKEEPASTFSQEDYFRQHAFYAFNALKLYFGQTIPQLGCIANQFYSHRPNNTL